MSHECITNSTAERGRGGGGADSAECLHVRGFPWDKFRPAVAVWNESVSTTTHTLFHINAFLLNITDFEIKTPVDWEQLSRSGSWCRTFLDVFVAGHYHSLMQKSHESKCQINWCKATETQSVSLNLRGCWSWPPRSSGRGELCFHTPCSSVTWMEALSVSHDQFNLNLFDLQLLLLLVRLVCLFFLCGLQRFSALCRTGFLNAAVSLLPPLSTIVSHQRPESHIKLNHCAFSFFLQMFAAKQMRWGKVPPQCVNVCIAHINLQRTWK